MPLTAKELAEIIERIDTLCREAQELQAQLRRAMVARARAELPDLRGQPERRIQPRKKVS
jgi:hypothetical protein